MAQSSLRFGEKLEPSVPWARREVKGQSSSQALVHSGTARRHGRTEKKVGPPGLDHRRKRGKLQLNPIGMGSWLVGGGGFGFGFVLVAAMAGTQRGWETRQRWLFSRKPSSLHPTVDPDETGSPWF